MPEWQKVLFYVLVFASIGVMFAMIWMRARHWLKGQAISWKPNYIRGIWVYVLGQKKVQGSRPKSGAPMHLMIFYGFLSLFLATTLLAIAFQGPINFHKGTYYLVYEMTFDILGLLLVVGVTWALVRRYKLVQKGQRQIESSEPEADRTYNPLTHDWRDYAGLLLLLGLGVGGYVLEAARMANNPQPWDWSAPIGFVISKLMGDVSNNAYIAIWWSHVVLFIAFVLFLPHMRLRHIVIATFTAAGHEERPMGKLEKIEMEQVEETGKIGVSEASDYSRWHLMSLDACMSCGRCTEVCPAYNVGKRLNPKQVVSDIHKALVVGEGVAATVSEEALWQCTTCNACVEACPVLIRHVDMIVDARRHLIAEGRFSGTGATMLRQVGSTNNAWGAAANTREDWMKDLEIPLCRDGVAFDYLLWVGCAGATDPSAVKTTKAVAALLKKAGVKFACLGREEACTGDPARRTGDEFMFQEKAAANQSVFEKYDVRKVITPCPHCFNTLKNEYGDFGRSMEVFHHTEFLADLVDEGKLVAARPKAGEVVYHDPCYLARVNNISDAPRKLVGEETQYDTTKAAAIHALEQDAPAPRTLSEPRFHAKKTLCCGAGGGRMWMEEEANQRPGNRRAKELLDTGAETVAVSCPFCRIMLDASLKQVSKDEVNLVDMAELLQEANR